MLPIYKLPEPEDLIVYKKERGENASYQEFSQSESTKAAFLNLREQLLEEQKYVCAYCGQAILSVKNQFGTPIMKTEHFEPQHEETSASLTYSNLLGCCLGNQKNKGPNHCDSHKGGRKLHHIKNPAFIQARDESIFYSVKVNDEEVLVFSSDDDVNKELDKILNLNHSDLKKMRFRRWNVLKNKLGTIVSDWQQETVEALIDDFSQEKDGRHQEFKDFIIWYLNDWIRRFG